MARDAGADGVLPHRVVAGGPEGGGDLGRRAGVADLELRLGGAGVGVPAGLGVGAGRHLGDAELERRVPERRRLPGRQGDADVGQGQAEGAEDLDVLAVGHGSLGLEVAGRRPHAGQGDGDLAPPPAPQQGRGVGGEGDDVGPPVGVEAEQGAEGQRAHAGLGGPVGGGQAPVVVALLALQVDGGVGVAVVDLLVDDQALASGLDQPAVGGGVPHLGLQRDRRHRVGEGGDALDQVVLGHDAGVLAGDQQEVAEAPVGQRAGLGHDLRRRQGAAGDLVAGGEAAVRARRDALVRQVERGEQAHHPAEPAHAGRVGQPGHLLQPGRRRRRQEGAEVGQRPAGGPQGPVDVGVGGRRREGAGGREVGGEEVGGGGVLGDAVRAATPGRRG